MKKSWVVGLLIGVLLTIAAAYFLHVSQIMSPVPTSPAESPVSGAEPLVSPDVDVKPNFAGSEDLIAHRARLEPAMTLENWDQLMATPDGSTSSSASRGCERADAARAILVSPMHLEGLRSGRMNVLFVDQAKARCFEVNNKVTLLVDDIADGKMLYNMLGEATVDRIFETAITQMPDAVLNELKIARDDLYFLINTEIAPVENPEAVTMLRLSFSPEEPLLDPTVIPSFVPGAETLKAESIMRYFKDNAKTRNPVFIDARDLKIAVADSYPGAILAPFISSNPAQLRFQLELPLSVLAGAKFDTSKLPASQATPLVVFGSDATDVAPLWVIRNLRRLNYRNLFYVEGGVTALRAVQPPITF